MTADVSTVGDAGVRRSGVKNWLTTIARPRLTRTLGQVKDSATLRSVPGVAAFAGFSASAGGLVGHFVHGIGPWVTVAVASWFLLRLDSRIG